MKQLPHLYFTPSKSRSASLTTDLFANGCEKFADSKKKLLPKDKLLLSSNVSICFIGCPTNNYDILKRLKKHHIHIFLCSLKSLLFLKKDFSC